MAKDFKESIGAAGRKPKQARMGAKSHRMTQSEGITGDDLADEKKHADEFLHECMEKFRKFQREMFGSLVDNEKPDKVKWKKYLEMKAFIDTLGESPKETDAALGRLMRMQGLDEKKIVVDTKQEQKDSILALFGVTGESRIANDDN